MQTRPRKSPATGRTPSADSLAEALRAEGMEPHGWSNGPGDIYAPHEHPYHKVLYCHSGSISFLLPLSGDRTPRW